MNTLAEAAGYWPLLLLPALFPLARWVYRRDQIAHPSIDQASHDRAEIVQPPENSTLDKLAQAGRAHAIVSELTRDPDPEPKHEYQRSPHSGAGNCVCGVPERHRRHPHDFVAADSKPELCTCALPRDAKCHRVGRKA